ncbi:MAG: hypothetical protein QFX33_01905 [Candidatus Nezhaarchaeota archaeon]|nr:hypothetical protein [Candidatus Nezhaarchaeota archaeon]
MSKGLAAAGALLALAVLALLCFVPIPSPYLDSSALTQGLKDLGVDWFDRASQELYNPDFLSNLMLGTSLWGYRAIDMLAQAFMVLGATCGVTALFRVEPPKEIIEEEETVVEAPLEEATEEV